MKFCLCTYPDCVEARERYEFVLRRVVRNPRDPRVTRLSAFRQLVLLRCEELLPEARRRVVALTGFASAGYVLYEHDLEDW